MPRHVQNDEPVALWVGVVRLELHLPDASSLKAKRSEVRRLVERIRSRHKVQVVEAGRQDLLQRSLVAICALSTDTVDLEARLQRVRNTVDDTWSGPVLGWDVDVMRA